jgi:hypothetical protein
MRLFTEVKNLLSKSVFLECENMTKEEIVNRLASAIALAEKKGLCETRQALIDIRSQIENESSDANPHRKEQLKDVLVLH